MNERTVSTVLTLLLLTVCAFADAEKKSTIEDKTKGMRKYDAFSLSTGTNPPEECGWKLTDLMKSCSTLFR